MKKFGDLIQLFGDENEEIKTLEFDSSLLKFKVFVLLKNLPLKMSFEMHFLTLHLEKNSSFQVQFLQGFCKLAKKCLIYQRGKLIKI